MTAFSPIDEIGDIALPHVTIAAIKIAVTSHYDLPLIDMVSNRRARDLAHPRQVAMYLARELTPHSYKVIGNCFGKRDHSTVLHAIRSVQRRIAADPALAAAVDALRRGLAQ